MSSLSIGIVGLPNVGKSTLFNAITHASVDAHNYPFCTIEPNVGIVPIPDPRLSVLSKISGTHTLVYATIQFTDIAGLVKGASKGEGLGNKFLSNIRDTTAIAHVVRCFDDPNIVHVNGTPNPIDDIEIIHLELIYSDLELVEKLWEAQSKKAKTQNKEELKKLELFEKIRDGLGHNKAIRHLDLSHEEMDLLRGYSFLTAKKVIYVANIDEASIGQSNPLAQEVQVYAHRHGDAYVELCSKLESEIALLPEEDRSLFLEELGLADSGLGQLSRGCFQLLGLQTYLTTGVKETRAWTIRQGDKAPQAAGAIHSDFEKGFIRANIVSYTDFVACGGLKFAKEKGLVRQEGKEYVMQEGDIVEFLFNV